MGNYWRRFVRVTVSLLPFAVAFARDHRRFLLFGGSRNLSERQHERRASELRDQLLALGPAFIKIGQVLSTRPDIVPQPYAETLATLQDEVPEDTGTDPVGVVKAEGLEDTLNPAKFEPVAGGSLAFVYETTYQGQRVAVKVQRPGVRDRIETDLAVIRRLLPISALVLPERYEFSLKNLADDFESVILEELDFKREARMMRSIDSNFDTHPDIRVPAVVESASTPRVLTMEFVESDPVTDELAQREADISGEELARRIATAFLRMGLVHGTFHADPHPGNLGIDPDGRLVLYDFGMSRRLDPGVQRQLVSLYRGLARQDPDQLTTALIELDALDPDVHRGEVAEILGLVIETLGRERTVEWTDIIRELIDSLRHLPFRIPPDMMLLLRVGTVAEGVCRDLDPSFDFVQIAREVLVEEGEMESELRTFLRELQQNAPAAGAAMSRTPVKLERTLDRINDDRVTVTARVDPPTVRQGGRVVGLAIIAGALVVGSAVLAAPYPRYAAILGIAAALVAMGFWWVSRSGTR